MNKFANTLKFSLVAMSVLTPAAKAQTLIDEWWTPGFSARVKLASCAEGDDKLCGTIVWAWDDTPTGAADKRPLLGQRIITGMKRDLDKTDKVERGASERPQTFAGSIYNPEDGHTYKATMRLKSANTLIVEGCVLFVCREQVWRRFDSLRSPPVSLK